MINTFELPEGPWIIDDVLTVRTAKVGRDGGIIAKATSPSIASAIASLPAMAAEIERLEAAFNASANAMRMDGVLAENAHLRAENAELRELVKAIAAVPLWRDTYPDGHDFVLNGNLPGYFTPDQVRKARALLATEQATNPLAPNFHPPVEPGAWLPGSEPAPDEEPIT